MAGVVLYLAIECSSVEAAHSMVQHFADAGLHTTDPRVHIAIGDPNTLTERTPDAYTKPGAAVPGGTRGALPGRSTQQD